MVIVRGIPVMMFLKTMMMLVNLILIVMDEETCVTTVLWILILNRVIAIETVSVMPVTAVRACMIQDRKMETLTVWEMFVTTARTVPTLAKRTLITMEWGMLVMTTMEMASLIKMTTAPKPQIQISKTAILRVVMAAEMRVSAKVILTEMETWMCRIL